MTRFISFTASGFQKIKEEKENILLKRKTAVDNLRTAREMGDLSENAAYKVARGQLSAIDSRISASGLSYPLRPRGKCTTNWRNRHWFKGGIITRRETS